MKEIKKENEEVILQDVFNEASMEELVGEAIIKNAVNEENIEEEEDGD